MKVRRSPAARRLASAANAAATLVFVATAPDGATAAARPKEPLRIVAFGTSLSARATWPDLIRGPLERCLARPVTISLVARPGATSAWGVDAVDDVVASAPDVVVIEFYANDAALDKGISVTGSRANLVRIVDRIVAARPAADVVMTVVAPVSGLRGLMRPWFDRYVAVHRAVMEERGFAVLDVRPQWARMSTEVRSAALPDGLHPRPDIAAGLLMPGLLERLSRRTCQ